MPEHHDSTCHRRLLQAQHHAAVVIVLAAVQPSVTSCVSASWLVAAGSFASQHLASAVDQPGLLAAAAAAYPCTVLCSEERPGDSA